MKEFWIYTALRLVLFAASFAVVTAAWLLIAGEASVLWALVIALLLSGVGSYFLLEPQREALARRVQTRAEAMTSKMEEMRSKEDQD